MANATLAIPAGDRRLSQYTSVAQGPIDMQQQQSHLSSKRFGGWFRAFFALPAFVGLTMLTACGVTARYEPYKQSDTVIRDGEQVVVLARRHHATHEAEQEFVECVGGRLARGSSGLDVYSSTSFEDALYPWLEPSTAPLSLEELAELLDRPLVQEQVQRTGVRYIVWLDGSTDRLSRGGGMACSIAIGSVGAAGCFGLAWWEDGARYDATVWDLEELEYAGTVHASVRGRSVMPAIIVPIPLITRPQARACRGMANQLNVFLTTPRGYGAGPEPIFE